MFYDKLGNSISVNLREKINHIYPNKTRPFYLKKKRVPKTIYAKKYLIKNLSINKKNSRCISVLGHIHHGKSTFINALSSSVHLVNQKSLFKEFADFFF